MANLINGIVVTGMAFVYLSNEILYLAVVPSIEFDNYKVHKKYQITCSLLTLVYIYSYTFYVHSNTKNG